MPLAKLAIKQPIFVTMVLLALTLVGVMSYMRMGVDLYPEMSMPMVSVSVSYPGASPQDVETLITKPMEASFASLNGVSSVSSTSREGMSMVSITFVAGFNLQQGAQEVRETLDSLSRRLPRDAGAPMLMRFDPSQAPFMTIAMANKGAPMSPADLNQLLSEVIEPRLERLEGVASVSMSGIPNPQVMVQLNAQKLDALRVSPTQVISALQTENTVMPSGSMSNNNLDVPIRTSAEFQTVDEIGQVIVARRGNLAIQLNQVGTVAYQLQKTQSISRVNGNNIYMIQISKQSGSNVVQTAGLVKDELKNLSQDFPDLIFTTVQDDSTFIQQSDRDVTLTLILGAVLAACIVFIFFRNIRNTIITVIGLPVIVMITFAIISALGYTRNIITLMALSLSIGLLIDDAIVVRENIFRHMENGEPPKVAADKATGEIAFAVLAISLTQVAMFIPVGFTSGQIGRLFKEFGITVSVAVIVSLFEAFTFAPLLSAYFAKPLKTKQEKASESPKTVGARVENVWQSSLSGYRGILGWSLRFRWLVAVVAVAIFAVAIMFVMRMPLNYFPTTDPGQISIGINMPTGTTLENTDPIAQNVEKLVMAQPETQRVYSRITAGSGSISVQLKDGVKTDPIIQRLRDQLSQYRANLIFSKPNQLLGVGGGMMMGGTNVRGRPIQISLQGPTSLETLDGVADDIVNRLSAVPGLRDTAKSLPPQQAEVHVVVDRQRATDAGVNATTVGSTIRAVFSSTTATNVDWQGRQTDVVVKMRDQDLTNVDVLMNLPVTAPSGIVYPLSSLAHVESGTGPTVLSRQDRQEQIVVGANLEGRTVGDALPDIRNALAGINLPAGVTWNFSGQAAQTSSAFSSLIFALLLGLLFVYMVLASQFGSFVHPFTVMASVPLAAIGAIFAIVITHTELTIISMIGLILMMGMATKNSILLVDFIIRYRRQGQQRREAILNAAPVRLRPILMTTFAIMLGMLPTALGMGAAGAFRAPMAIAVLGGVFSSTLLSLVVVPVVYTYIDDILVGITRLFRRNPVLSVSPTSEIISDQGIDLDPAPGVEADPPDPPATKNNKRRKRKLWPFGAE